MSRKIYLGDTPRSHNPINTKEYQKILGLNPTLSQEIQKHVEGVLYQQITPIEQTKLYDNRAIVSKESITLAQHTLISKLHILEELTGVSEHIALVKDSCFTNTNLTILLRKILGKAHFEHFVKDVSIDYQSPSDNAYLEQELSTNHSLIILGGSLSDTYSIHPSHYEGYLFQDIRQVTDDYHLKYLNKRYLGLCFGQQFLANVIGIANHTPSTIIATIKGPAQFGPSNCHIEDLQYTNPIFRKLLAGITNYGKNNSFSVPFTRTGYVHFDLLSNGGNLGVVPLIQDEMTSTTVGWGSENGNVLGVQFHPELEIASGGTSLKRQLRPLLSYLSNDPKKQDEIIQNFQVKGIVERDIGEAFYTYVLLEYITDIIEKYHNLQSILEEKPELETIPYSQRVERLLKITSSRVNFLLKPAGKLVDLGVERQRWIEAIDQSSRLHLNHRLDWKVSRDSEEVSEILGLTSITDVINFHQDVVKDPHFTVVDNGAGDGNTLKELSDKLEGKNILFYGVGDYIYFDLYAGLKKFKIIDEIPHDLVVLFVEKVVKLCLQVQGATTLEKLKNALELVVFSPTDTINHSSMTSSKTYMFSTEGKHQLSSEIQSNFSQYAKMLEKLRSFSLNHTTDLVGDFFHNIYISKFLGLHINDEYISQVNFQYAIRSTSHISGRQYMRVLSDYIFKSAKYGSLYIDNGIHQSYTSIPRLKELFELSRDVVDTQFKLIYDANTNYFPSVIITKDYDFLEDERGRFLRPGMKMVPLVEAYRSTFFRLEYFIRNFIITNFKNDEVFWDFNNQIIETLQHIIQELTVGNTKNISELILQLINHIALNFHQEGITYNTIEGEVLLAYSIDGEKLSDIINREVYIPSWMNIDAKRRY